MCPVACLISDQGVRIEQVGYPPPAELSVLRTPQTDCNFYLDGEPPAPKAPTRLYRRTGGPDARPAIYVEPSDDASG